MTPPTPFSSESPAEHELLRPEDLQPGPGTRIVGRRIVCHRSLGSTNDEGMRLAQEGVEHGTAVFAEHQTAGRGRRGRKWVSPPRLGLWFSVIFSSMELNAEPWVLTCAAGLAILEAIEGVSKIRATLKWPNDVTVDGRKLAGILTERRADNIVLGIGVNVNHLSGDFPDDLREVAVSLRMATGIRIDRAKLARSILEELEIRISCLDPDQIRQIWKERSGFLGRQVRIEYGEESFVGIAEELNQDGSLNLRLESGKTISIHSGDAHLLPSGAP